MRCSLGCGTCSRNLGAADRLSCAGCKTIGAAERGRILGSPSVRGDGYDHEPGADERTDDGLKCRLYRAASGMQGEPRTDWVLAALGLAASSASGQARTTGGHVARRPGAQSS